MHGAGKHLEHQCTDKRDFDTSWNAFQQTPGKRIRALAGTLKILNLKEANIVEDKVTSYRGTGSTANYTQNDVIGDYMFYGMTALTKVVLPKTVWSIGTWSKDNPWNEEKTQVSGDPKKKRCQQ